MKKTGKILLKIGEWTLFAMILVIFAVLLSPMLPTKQYFASFAVVSGSMEPVIPTGSIAFITPAEIGQVQKGDIIAFQSPSNPKATILHRVSDVTTDDRGTLYTTKGDANSSTDNEKITYEHIRGTYEFSIPYIGYLVGTAKTPLGFGLMVGIPGLILILLQLRSIKKGIDEEVQKRVNKKIEEQTPHKPEFGINKWEISVILLFSSSFLSVSPAYALFSSDVTLSGMSVSTKETFSQVSLKLTGNKKKAIIQAKDIKGYTHLTYTLTYISNSVTQMVTGEEELNGNQNAFNTNIDLGTCSSTGCVYHPNPHDFLLEIVFENEEGETISVTQTL